MRHPAHAYRQFSIQGATPLSLVVMLYDGAIAGMRRAAAAIAANDIQEKCNQLNRALAIIGQLEGTLNFELGGDAAQTLKSFYVYGRSQILKANIENSSPLLHSVIEKFAAVREAWHQADRQESSPPSTPSGGASSRQPAPVPRSGPWRMSA